MTVAALLAAAAVLLLHPAPVQARGSRLPVVLAAAVVAGWLGSRVSVTGAMAAAVVVMAVGGLAVRRRRAVARQRVARRRVRVQGFCEDLAAELAAGLPAERSLASAAAGWTELDRVVAAHRLGGSVPAALRDLSTRPGAEDLRLVAAAWQVGQRNGAGLAETLAQVAEGIRRRRATRRVVESELASARATARLVAGLPVLTLALGSSAGGSPVGFLLTTPLGLACLAAGLLLGLAGLLWIEAIASGVDAP